MRQNIDGVRAMPQAARATHAAHRANLRCLGLSVGIAIALSGCDAENVSGFECAEAHPGWRTPEHFSYVGRSPMHIVSCIYVTDTEGWQRKMCESGPDEYTCRAATVRASAGEAGTATTVQQGVVHEHATAATSGGDARHR